MGLLDSIGSIFGGGGGGGSSKKEAKKASKAAEFKLPSPEEIMKYLVPIGTNANPGYPGVGSTMNLFPGATNFASGQSAAGQGMMGLQQQGQQAGMGNLANLAAMAALFPWGGAGAGIGKIGGLIGLGGGGSKLFDWE